MSKKRIKIPPAPSINTRVEAEAAVNDLANSANNKRQITAQMDREILAIQERFQGNILACDQGMQATGQALEAWAITHPEEFPKGIKSIKFLTGTIGFRTGGPKLAPISRLFTWETILGLVQTHLPNFIRTVPEIDKAAIINQREEEGIQIGVKLCGMKIVQDEGFYVEPNLSDPSPQA